tara:strand:- start:161 stop:697 length:537 start_codon:yes stop_codon:yes gene_type:complete
MNEQEVKVQDEKQDTTTVSEPKQPVNDVPYARFKELIDEKNEMKSQLDTLNKQIKGDEESRKLKEMEAKGEYDKIMADLNSKLETSEKKSKAWDEYQASRRDALLSKLPEEDRETYDGLSLDKLEAHVDKFNSKSKVPNVNNSNPMINSDPNIGDWTKLSADDKRKNWSGIMDSFKKK